jgi:phospholipase/carboxylesterase
MSEQPPLSRRTFIRSTLVAAIAAPALLTRCADPVAPPDRIRLGARPGEPTMDPTYGTTPLGIGGSRDGLMHVPESYDPDEPMPLFIALHPAWGSGSTWTSYPPRAERHGFIFLAPDSRAYTWGTSSGAFGPDTDFLDLALAHAFARCRVDPQRIAFGGFAAGASFALSLGVANGDLFSHLVGFTPTYFAPAEPRTGLPRAFVSHGVRDPVAPFLTTANFIVPRLVELGHDVTYHWFDGEHGVPAAVSEAALHWFLDTEPEEG